jgi:hypothetical protein
MRPLMPACLLLSLVACGPSVTGGGDDDDTLIDARVDSPTGGACTPGVNVCVGTEVHACLPDGTVGPSPLQNCAPMTCVAGQCMTGGGATTCADAEASRSYLGCEYWPVDLTTPSRSTAPSSSPGSAAPPAGGAGFVPRSRCRCAPKAACWPGCATTAWLR